MSGAEAELPIPARASALPGRPGAKAGDLSDRLEPSIQPPRVMALALVAWGLGHRALGDRRWPLLLLLEIAWLAALVAALPLLATDRWILVFGFLSGFLLVWMLQAVAAQRAAVRRSGRSTGAALLFALMPVAIVAVTAFWLSGGTTASPTATFARYVSAWETRHPENAIALFVSARDAASLSAAWTADDRAVLEEVEAISAANPTWDLDERHPYANLRFVYHDGDEPASPDRALVDIEIVRLATLPTTFFGLFPATRSETQPVATIGQAVLVRRPAAVPSLASASVWLIESVSLGD